MTDMLVESRIRGNMYVRFGGEYKETSHRNMKRRHILSLLNHLPNLHNAYGFDIDGKAVAVARYLYPEAHIEKCDIQLYNPEQRFDIIVGNPPFNLKFDYRLSQEFYMDKAYDVLNPAGILMVIVPLSFMQNEFWEKTRVAKINSNFSFIGQTRLDHSAFSTVGVQNFATKSWYSSAVPSILKCSPTTRKSLSAWMS